MDAILFEPNGLNYDCSQTKQNLNSKYKKHTSESDSLVGFLHVGTIGTLTTVICLDCEGVLLLQLTVQLVLSPDDPLASGLVQDHCLEGDILPMDPEAANLT